MWVSSVPFPDIGNMLSQFGQELERGKCTRGGLSVFKGEIPNGGVAVLLFESGDQIRRRAWRQVS